MIRLMVMQQVVDDMQGKPGCSGESQVVEDKEDEITPLSDAFITNTPMDVWHTFSTVIVRSIAQGLMYLNDGDYYDHR